MPLFLASKEEILAEVQANNCDYFVDRKFFQGSRTDHGDHNSNTYKDFYNRRFPQDGSSPQLTPEEQVDVDVEFSVEEVERRDEGDGHYQYMTLYFVSYDLNVSLVGRYSSYSDSCWDNVFISETFQYTETRYRRLGS